MTPASLGGVPNQERTPRRTVRVPDDVWAKASAKAEQRGEVLSEVIRRFLERYGKRA
jgi:macrodomain Ter protein organizer (MatP/YcbG family)